MEYKDADESKKFMSFFRLGRKLGWNPKEWKWTVNNLIGPATRHPYFEDVGGIPPRTRLDWCGDFMGPKELRQLIIERFEYDIAEDEVITTSGTMAANWLATIVSLTPNSGDEVVVDLPSWMVQFSLYESLGVKRKVIMRKWENDWKIDPNELNELVTPKTKHIFLNHPNNPTGGDIDEKDLKAVVEIAKDVGAYVICDEEYRGFTYEGEKTPAVVNYYEKGISNQSLSKIFGLDGIRLGWLTTRDKEFMTQVGKWRQNTGLKTNRLNEIVSTQVLQPSWFKKWMDQELPVARKKREMVANWMDKQDKWDWVKPKAGFLSLPKFDMDIGSWKLCERLLKEPYKTYVYPGIGLGTQFDSYVRIGWGEVEPEEVKAGLDALDQFTEDYEKGRAF